MGALVPVLSSLPQPLRVNFKHCPRVSFILAFYNKLVISWVKTATIYSLRPSLGSPQSPSRIINLLLSFVFFPEASYGGGWCWLITSMLQSWYQMWCQHEPHQDSQAAGGGWDQPIILRSSKALQVHAPTPTFLCWLYITWPFAQWGKADLEKLLSLHVGLLFW